MGVKHKYLDDIGVEYKHLFPYLYEEENNKLHSDTQKFFQKEYETYGFTSNETWDLDNTFYKWIYERTKRFIEVGEKVNAKIIDMDLEKKKIELSIRELEGTSSEYSSKK